MVGESCPPKKYRFVFGQDAVKDGWLACQTVVGGGWLGCWGRCVCLCGVLFVWVVCELRRRVGQGIKGIKKYHFICP